MGFIALDNPLNENYKQKEFKMTSDFMKTKLLEYFRFKRRFPFCCTEGIRQADVNACSEDKLIEVEVKISKSDLKREFSKNSGYEKTSKHDDYLNQVLVKETINDGMMCSNISYSISPNLFYLAIPDDLIKAAEDEIERVNPKYGIIIVYSGGGLFGDNIRIYRQAKPLHKNKPDNKTIKAICQRCTNELITLRQRG